MQETNRQTIHLSVADLCADKPGHLCMVVAVVIGGMFRLQTGSIREWARAASGGLLMGIGATLVPGGNDTMLFTGIPLLLPNLLIAYAAFVVTLYLALFIGSPKDGQQISASA